MYLPLNWDIEINYLCLSDFSTNVTLMEISHTVYFRAVVKILVNFSFFSPIEIVMIHYLIKNVLLWSFLILLVLFYTLIITFCTRQIVVCKLCHIFIWFFFLTKNDYNFRTKGHNPDCVFKTMSLPCDISIRFKLVSTGIWSVITL
jgi:hypothetical protein